jgi:beta-lysine 5,6-aminomutase beta subunit
VENAALAAAAVARGADAVLVSQVVTQRDVHRDNARRLVDELERLGKRRGLILLLGGPRIDQKLALELGYDAGFGPGTRPSDVANWLVGEVLRRMGKEHHG